MSFGTVCAPGQRYHPAVIAQAAATICEMYPGLFWLAVGSGEAHNEHITGEPWPPKPERNARLKECVEIMRRLWAGERVNHQGLVSVKDAQLPTVKHPPKIIAACISDETARWAGSWADGLLTVSKAPEDLRKTVEAFRDGGGAGKPMYLQVGLSYAATDKEALEAACQRWRIAGLMPESLQAKINQLLTDDVPEQKQKRERGDVEGKEA
jgi:coenzyme F420-dependent glucose-6-phosphate dehydrogenase